MRSIRKVMVIKLSAMGDFVLAVAAFERIRAVHRDAQITLLTTPPFEELARSSPFFDRVRADGRPRSLGGWLALVARLRAAGYDRIYDLQNSGRTKLYFQALRPLPPQWSGVAAGCALPHRNPDRMRMHALERQAQQLKDAGIWPDAPTRPLSAPPPDLAWMLATAPTDQAIAVPGPRPTALLVPGSSAHRPDKRWPIERYAALSEHLQAKGFEVVIIGAGQESELAQRIRDRTPWARDLTGRTSFAQIGGLGARCAVAIGNDTGPVHLLAAAGAPTVCLFSSASDPALCGPRGEAAVLWAPDLQDLPVATVLDEALLLANSS
ncbi:MAG TPA: glycosyltransferase family 9 protein [Caulobacteraceae bacterium]